MCEGIGFDETDDCCIEPGCYGDDSCCQPYNQCSIGQGDCDTDEDCKGNLVCGNNNCDGKGFDNTDDCCIEPGNNLPVTLRLLEYFGNLKNEIYSKV